jgi:hypothetical protein
MIDSVARLTDPAAMKLNDQLIDHIHLFHLFGDPLLTIPFPEQVKITGQVTAHPGEIVRITGEASFDGPIYLELTMPRTRQPLRISNRSTFESNEKTRLEYMKTYRTANNRSLLYVPGQLTGGRFDIPLKIPDDLDGEYIIRCFTAHSNGTGIGSKTIRIVSPQTADRKTSIRQ